MSQQVPVGCPVYVYPCDSVCMTALRSGIVYKCGQIACLEQNGYNPSCQEACAICLEYVGILHTVVIWAVRSHQAGTAKTT